MRCSTARPSRRIEEVRILLVNNYYPEHVGGVETVAASLVAGYRKRGHEVRWIAGEISSNPHAGEPGDMPFRVWNGIERLGFPYPLPSPLGAARLRRHVSWAQAVHIHDCLYALSIATFAAAGRERRPVLLTQHVAKVPYRNPLYRGLQSAAYATIGRAVLSRADQVVFESERVRRWFEARVRFRTTPLVIENGIDDDLFEPLPTPERDAVRSGLGANGSRPLLLFVGRFVEKKGVRLLRPLIKSTPKCDWLLIGRAGEVDPSSWRLPNVRVIAPVRLAELRGYYCAADLLVLPSSGEGFPVVAQQAMACGTPALLADETVSGLPSIQDLVFASRLTDEDLQSTLRQALVAVAADGGLRDRVAIRAHERWSIETMVARHEELLEGLIR